MAILAYLDQLLQKDQRNIKNVIVRLLKQIHKDCKDKEQLK